MRELTSRALTAIISITLLFGMVGCSEDTTGTDPMETGSISGVVTDSISGDPIAGARISTEPVTTNSTTDATGAYSLSALSIGTYSIVVEKDGYVRKEVSAVVSSQQTLSVNIALSPDANFTPLDTLIQVLRFDGEDDYVLIADTNPSDLSDEPFTIELWCRPNRLNSVASNGVDNRWNFLVGHGQNDVDLDYMFGFEDRKPMFYVRRKGSGHVGEASISNDTWYHYAVVQDTSAGEVRIYINGQLDSKSALSGSSQLSAADIFVGAREDNGTGEATGFFEGEIFELRMWNVVRSENEIESSRWKILAGSEPGLIGYWPMTDGSGAVVSEKTEKNIVGTIDGAIWIAVANPMLR